MIRSHHITAQLAREHQRDLIGPVHAARARSEVDDLVGPVDRERPEGERGTILRHLHVRRHDPAAARSDGRPQPVGRAA